MTEATRKLSTAAGDCDGLHIDESGSVVAIAGDTMVIVPLSTDEMCQFASMLQSAAAHIDKKRTIRPGEGIRVEARVGGR
jgi:hypothetical protein